MSFFHIKTNIITNTFNNNLKFLYTVKTDLTTLKSCLNKLDLSAYLKDVYKLGSATFNELKRNPSTCDIIHTNFKENINKFLECYNKQQIVPYCPVLNTHPLEIKGNSLHVKEDIIEICTSERKREISSSYGEALGRLLLAELDNVDLLGILKIESGNSSTPDFLIVDNNKKIKMVSEIKSSINNSAKNPREQLKDGSFNGLGIQVNFKKGNNPIEMKLKDPVYTLEGDIFPAIYTNNILLAATLKIIDKGEEPPFKINNNREARKAVEYIDENIQEVIKWHRREYDNKNLKEYISDGVLHFENKLIDNLTNKHSRVELLF